ncbi:phosphomannomutase [Photorhabdus luminescens]|uniref:Phosphomannomutase n=1 Tax=Photorhabdus luminescens subsp. sonorensis TaxID=1173677 RepID=A0A5C4RNG9_PHOLU|nr:phosphomannomutase [Photorhabdus luminescens]TNH45191.1 phosphomannomutase [Photorhabdus luminescens subsp. sonorensis]
MLKSFELISQSGIQFGTSGARGLVTQFTPNVCAAFTHAFITSIKDKFNFKQVAIAIDNRPSSLSIAQACIFAIEQRGFIPVYYGVIPTPALAYIAMQDNIPCIMVTGSHIPFDRNGLKFYRPDGEITKSDEQAILNANIDFSAIIDPLPPLQINSLAAKQYIERYISIFDKDLLLGKRIGIYEHSSAGRDIYAELLKKLGAEVVSLERSDEFIPIDTEAVSDSDKIKAKEWSKTYQLDTIFSTDGDGDRPLIADENGEWLRGDILGLLCSIEMNIEAIAIPVSCNTIISRHNHFKQVRQTRIGSPYIIEEFISLSNNYQRIAGFEANGGFLLGSDININGKILRSLPTRDAVLPFLMLLSAAKDKGISQLVDELPKRITYSSRIKNFATEISLKMIKNAQKDPEALLQKLGFDKEQLSELNTIDGLRMILSNSNIIHLRPSGNAPELRCYVEANDAETAKYIVEHTLHKIQNMTDF